MTTIVYDAREKLMVADSAIIFCDNAIVGRRDKILATSDGGLFAGSGVATDIMKVAKWVNAGMAEYTTPTVDDVSAIYVYPSGDVVLFNKTLIPMPILADFYAVGSGFEFAMGAMHAGATAVQAVEIACKLDAYSRLPITTKRLGDN